ncbi:MAG: hypothetical protein KVP17_004722 [Porospora cf. gigantea B]|uniref:uncharacterized protein n=1 Tax=Porospora cf. gigantea B TaxID=2853592 RepID=UPI003571F6D1|nr:MAG: hypothetical protein KVP17_004722 [Porospora cf. gigantea B]
MASQAAQLKDLGNQAFSSKDFEKAVILFGQAIELDPSNHVLWSNRSGAYASLGDYEKAEADAQKCVELNPKWCKGYSRLGLALIEQGKVMEAATAYKAGSEIDPNNAAIKEGINRCQQAASGMFNKDQLLMTIARQLDDPLYRQYQEEDPTFLTRVVGLMQKLMENPSQEALQMALVMNPDERVAAACAKLMGVDLPRERQPAKKAPAKPKETKPELSSEEAEAEEFKNLANTLYKSRKFEEALDLYDKAIEKNPRQLLYVNNKAAVFIEQGRYVECEALLQSALDQRYEVQAAYETVAKIYNRLAVLYKKQGQLDKAIEMYDRSLTEDNNRLTRAALKECQKLHEENVKKAYVDPTKAEEHRVRGNDFFKLQQFPEAKKEYDEAIRRDPTNAKLYSNRAAALTSLMELPSALRDVEVCLQLDPVFVRGWSRKGSIHYMMKEYHKSMEAYQKGLDLDPRNAECRSGLERTVYQIQSQSGADQMDEERVQMAMKDPEIQKILGDPQFQLILQEISNKPELVNEYMRDPKISEGIQKLIAAGIVRVA